MKQEYFVRERRAFWESMEKRLAEPRRAFSRVAAGFPRDFRRLSQDLNTARAGAYDPVIVERLERIVLACHQRLYSARRWSPRSLLVFLSRDLPRSVRSNWRGLAAAAFFFYGLAVGAAFLVIEAPEAVYDIIPYSQIQGLESMYNPESEYYLEPRQASGDADMFGYYIYNNISIAFLTFAGGAIAGVGSALFLGFNALFLGAAAGHIVNKGFSENFFLFIFAHSAFELTAMLFSGVAGFHLGWSLLVTRDRRRAASFQHAGRRVLPLAAGSGFFLVIAAALEAFWSSRHELLGGIRLAAGAGMWILVILYLALAGRRGKEYGGSV